MAIKLINPDEKLTFKRSDLGLEISYRRPTQTERAVWERKATKKGVVDGNLVAEKALEFSVLGWKGVVDDNGKAVPFNPELIPALPLEIIVELLELLGVAQSAGAQDKQLKN